MLLQRLIELADSLEEQGKLTPPLYKKKWIHYLIELDNNGRLLNPRPIDLSEVEDGHSRGMSWDVPHVVRARSVKPLLLADHAEYTLGLGREKTKPERVEKCHAGYMELLEECVTETKNPVVAAVLTFLQNNPLEQLDLGEEFSRNDAIVFRVDDQFAHRQASVQKFWAAHHSPESNKGEGEMQCIICGQEKPVMDRLPGKIKGIPGGHSVGTAIISANENAYESYGLKASKIAPTCLECADRFTKALNYLLSDDSHYVWFSSLIFAFWTSEPVGTGWATWYKKPDPQMVHDLIASVRSGHWDPEVDEIPFYSVSLSGSGGRAVVRDWIDTTVGKVKASLAKWFQGQKVVDAWGEEALPLGVYALGGATARDLKDVSSPTYRTLLRGGLLGTPLPWNLLQQAVWRNHAENDVTRARAALIKLVMTTQNLIKENEMVKLQFEHEEPAYHCGRLLSVLENIQRKAQGKLNTTIVDRFYGTASTAPASVFGRLLSGAQPHLSKLRRDKPGTEVALQKRLEEVIAQLPSFPHTLDLKQQGFFALGYYHQRAHDRAQARAYSEQKETESKI